MDPDMTAKNEFLPFALNGSTATGDILSPDDYASDADRPKGNQSMDKARRDLVNTAARQASSIASALAGLVCEVANVDMLDNGDIATMTHNIATMIDKLIDNKLEFVSQVPIGMFGFFFCKTRPKNWMPCDGSLLMRGQFNKIWDHAQKDWTVLQTDTTENYGAFTIGDGLTTFRMPKIYGLFPRIFNPEADGIDAGRNPGDFQDHGIPAITGNIYNGGITGLNADGVFQLVGSTNGREIADGGTTPTINFDSTRVIPDATDVRGKNVALPAYMYVGIFE